MSLNYQAVGWNRQKRIYDGLIVAGVVTYLGLFIGVGVVVRPEATAETLLIRGFGTAALHGLGKPREVTRKTDTAEILPDLR